MYLSRWSVFLTIVGVGGGLLLTLLSGVYTVKPFVVDAEIIYFGFPLAWFEAFRGGGPIMDRNMSWRYYFVWPGFIIDFMLFGLLTVAAIYLYFITTTVARKQGKATVPS